MAHGFGRRVCFGGSKTALEIVDNGQQTEKHALAGIFQKIGFFFCDTLAVVVEFSHKEKILSLFLFYLGARFVKLVLQTCVFIKLFCLDVFIFVENIHYLGFFHRGLLLCLRRFFVFMFVVAHNLAMLYRKVCSKNAAKKC